MTQTDLLRRAMKEPEESYSKRLCVYIYKSVFVIFLLSLSGSEPNAKEAEEKMLSKHANGTP